MNAAAPGRSLSRSQDPSGEQVSSPWDERPSFALDADVTVYWPDVRPCWEDDEPVICQGCGAYADISRLGQSHNCHRNEDGSYEEGGTFQ